MSFGFNNNGVKEKSFYITIPLKFMKLVQDLLKIDPLNMFICGWQWTFLESPERLKYNPRCIFQQIFNKLLSISSVNP